MSKVTLSHPFDEIHGKLSKNDKIINRQKKYRDESGRIIFEGIQEAYAVKKPRDWKKNPPKGAELANITSWQEACRRAAQILQAGQPDGPTKQQLFSRQFSHIPDYYTLDEARELYTLYRNRYLAQLPGKRGTHPDPSAPLNPITGAGKRYPQFPNFLRAILYHEMKNAN